MKRPFRPTRKIGLLCCAAAALYLSACDAENENDTSDTAEPSADTDKGDTGFVSDDGIVFPGDVWPEDDPESHGFDGDALDDAAAFSEEQDTHCLMVVHDGYVIGEWYFDDWDVSTQQNVFSVTKSFTSAAVGIAQDEGLLSVDDSAADYITEWQGTESETVTVAHLLSNTSGREWAFLADYLTLGLQTDKTAYAVGLDQEFTPGEVWEYNNTAVQTLDRVLMEASGERLADFATTRLLEPLGMSAFFGTDDAGNTVTFSDVQSSCSDLARFGYLVLQKGLWGDTRILSEAYLDAATSPSSTLNAAYGYLFWLNRDGYWIKPSTSDTDKPEGDGRIYPTLPDDLISAEGMQDQLIVVLPSENLVMTRIGGENDPLTAVLNGNLGDDAFVESLIGKILDAKTN